MFTIDQRFMEEIGIATMPEQGRARLVAGIEGMIQNRVYIEIADELTDALMTELESLSESPQFATRWLVANVPHYAGSREFEEFKRAATATADMTTEQLFATVKWFGTHFPGFSELVQRIKDEVKAELKQLR